MLFTVVNVQFITGSQLGIHKVIGTWNTWGKHWHVQGGVGVGRGSSSVGWGGIDTAGVHVCDRANGGFWHQQMLLHRFVLKFCLLPQSSYFTFISGLWRIIKNTSCCECTSNNQTLIVLLCCNVQSKYLYIYSVKQMTGGKIKIVFNQLHQRQGRGGEIKKKSFEVAMIIKSPTPPFCSIILR